MKKTEVLIIRISEKEKNQIKDSAEKQDMTISEYARFKLLEKT